MTKLEKKLKEKNISIYQLLKEMSLNPLQRQGTWTKKIRGERQLNTADKNLLVGALKNFKINKKEIGISKEDIIYRIN